MNPASLFFRTFLLAVFTLSLVGGAIATDYYLRHELTRKAKRFLADRGVPLAPASAVEAAKEGDLPVLEQLELAGLSLGLGDAGGETPLLAAVRAEDAATVDFLMERPEVAAAINEATEAGRETPLSVALRSRNFPLADRLLEQGASPDADIEPGLPFLVGAVREDDGELFDYLLAKGVAVDHRGTQPATALAEAADRGDLEKMRRLLAAGADPNVRGTTGKPLLVEAVKDGSRAEFDLLLANRADVNAKTADGWGGELSALSFAVASGDVAVQEALLEAGATTSIGGAGGDPLLCEAVAAGDHDLVGRLLKRGGGCEVLSRDKLSPLGIAVRGEDIDLVDLLLSGGADPSFSADGVEAPLLAAVSRGNLAIAHQLIGAGAEIDKQALLAMSYSRRDDPLMHLVLKVGADPESTFPGTQERVFDAAVRDGATGAVRTLLAAGAKIGDNLWAALLTGQDDLIRLILQAGASPRQPGPNGQDPLDYCLTNERYAAARILLDGGANPNARFDQNETWLSKAVREGKSDVALALVEKGAAVKGVRASDGHSLIGWALAHKMTDVAVALVKAGIEVDADERTPAHPAFRDKFESTTFRYHLQVDSRIRPLMMAAAQRDHEVAQALMDAGAKGNAYSRKYLFAASIGAWFKDTRMQQICLIGRVPNPQPRKVVVSLSSQRVTLYENGVATFSTPCSTGRAGHRTPPGEYVISDRHRHHTSNIYHSSMPYFQRFSFSAFGLHQGVLPGYPASAGCIRLTNAGAAHLWSKLKVGDLAIIQP